MEADSVGIHPKEVKQQAAGSKAGSGTVEQPCSASDPADMIPPWPCQQLLGGLPPYIYQGCDPDTGLCHHPECNPANEDHVPNPSRQGTRACERTLDGVVGSQNQED